jgi:excisionase family DNA binding protein
VTEFYTPKEISDLLGIGHSTARSWIASGVLPGVRIGPRLLRVPVKEFRYWAAKNGVRLPSTEQGED